MELKCFRVALLLTLCHPRFDFTSQCQWLIHSYRLLVRCATTIVELSAFVSVCREIELHIVHIRFLVFLSICCSFAGYVGFFHCILSICGLLFVTPWAHQSFLVAATGWFGGASWVSQHLRCRDCGNSYWWVLWCCLSWRKEPFALVLMMHVYISIFL